MHDFPENPWVQNMQLPDIYDDYYSMQAAPEEQLERMYPQIYFIINPVVIRHCDMLDDTYGPSYIPTEEEFENIVNNIYSEVESRVKAEASKGSGNPHNPDGSPFLRGLIGTLLIRELLPRRRRNRLRRFPRFFPGFFPYYPGFFPGFF